MAFDPASTRLHRSYKVTLAHPDGPKTFTVNLAYDVNETFDAIENNRVVHPNSVQAQLAAVNRLRRLSDKGRVEVTREDIDDADWDVALIRQSLKDST